MIYHEKITKRIIASQTYGKTVSKTTLRKDLETEGGAFLSIDTIWT